MSTENDDQHHVDDSEQPPAAADEPTTAGDDDAAADVWREATGPEDGTAAAERPGPPDPAAEGGEEPPDAGAEGAEEAEGAEPAAGPGPAPTAEPAAAESAAGPGSAPTAEPAAAPGAGAAEPATPEPTAAGDSAAGESEPAQSVAAESTSEPESESESESESAAAGASAGGDEPRLAAVPDSDRDTEGSVAGQRIGESPAEDAARQLISSVEGFLGSVFKDASETVDRIAGKSREQTRRAEPPADPTEFLESVESWLGEFFRGAPGKAARGFGRAAAGSALRSTSGNNSDDVWASATSADDTDTDRDASRECKYCPFCQTLAAVRNTRPELYEQIGDTAQTLVDLVKQAAEQSRGRRPWR